MKKTNKKKMPAFMIAIMWKWKDDVCEKCWSKSKASDIKNKAKNKKSKMK